MTTLVLGGSKGKTSSRLASLLSENNIPFVLASRSVSNSCPYPQIHFDWLDEKTYGEPFKHGEISAVYIVAPPVTDMFPPMKAFIDFAFKEKRVRRFVLLSASSLERGGPMMGQAHDYLLKLATEHEGLEYAVLRPTWFMENFSEGPHQLTIKITARYTPPHRTGKSLLSLWTILRPWRPARWSMRSLMTWSMLFLVRSCCLMMMLPPFSPMS
ncbi:hypothetical protein VTN96DRAFT_2287 [Rasamsonia emersonii]